MKTEIENVLEGICGECGLFADKIEVDGKQRVLLSDKNMLIALEVDTSRSETMMKLMANAHAKKGVEGKLTRWQYLFEDGFIGRAIKFGERTVFVQPKCLESFCDDLDIFPECFRVFEWENIVVVYDRDSLLQPAGLIAIMDSRKVEELVK